jgi:secondary thiamine-phosphate synthase enzyme
MHRLTIRSSERQQLIDISSQVAAVVRDWPDGVAIAYAPHTTAGVLINANADPDVADDFLRALDAIVPEDAGFRHAGGNSASHVKTVLVGTSQTVPLSGGKLQLGTWQSIFLAEFDGPRTRSVLLVPLTAG